MLDDTHRGRLLAQLMRRWYEKNRETWWDRNRPHMYRRVEATDDFMVALMREADSLQSLSDDALILEWQEFWETV